MVLIGTATLVTRPSTVKVTRAAMPLLGARTRDAPGLDVERVHLSEGGVQNFFVHHFVSPAIDVFRQRQRHVELLAHAQQLRIEREHERQLPILHLNFKR